MKRKVVIVEDDPSTVKLVEVILDKKDYEVMAVIGEQAVDLIAREKPDLVLLDLMMPRVDGWNVYQRMKADDQLKDIPVIVVTARADRIDKELGLHVAKVQDYITKPFTPDQLLNSIRMVLGDDVQPPQQE